MLVTKDEAMKITAGLRLAGTAVSNGYGGTKLCDIRTYSGKHGSGYAVTSGKRTSYYVYDKNVIDRRIYDGEYSVASECMSANNIHTVRVRNADGTETQIVPTWMLELDTVSGDTVFKRSYGEFRPMSLAGRTLTVMWRGDMDNRTLRRKIRRKLKEYLDSGKAIFFNENTQFSEQGESEK